MQIKLILDGVDRQWKSIVDKNEFQIFIKAAKAGNFICYVYTGII